MTRWDSGWVSCTYHMTIKCTAVPIRWYGAQPYTYSLDILVMNFKVPNLESKTFKHFLRSMAHQPVNALSGVPT
jgi:hypothetical protein